MSQPPPPARGLWSLVKAVIVLAALATSLVVLSLVPMYPLTLLEHFRLQLLFACAAATLLAALARVPVWFDLALVNTLLALVLVTPALGGAPLPAASGAVAVRVLLANVLTSNPDHQEVAALIAETKPDLIALVEPNRVWFAALAPSLTGYRGRIEIDDAANFGLALYARGEVTGSAEPLGSTQATLVATVTLDDSRAAPLTVVLTHPIPPMTEAAQRIHGRHLEAVAERAAELPRPLLLLGDLNTTPWTRSFAKLAHTAGLVDTRRGFGVQATYPAFPAFAAPVRIPIDHALVSPELGVLGRRIERPIGSDHLPVLLELAVPAR